MNQAPVNNFFEYIIPKKESAPAGQIYLGTFLAFTLLFSFFFGNLLFFLIVLIIAIFIFLEKEVEIADESGNIKVGFYSDSFYYANKEYKYSSLLSFTFVDEVFGENEKYLRITFKSPAQPDLFIFIPEHVQRNKIYDIIHKSVKEDSSKELSFTDQVVLRFF